MNLVVSISGGETSALMSIMISESEYFKNKYETISYVFANTSCENEETLLFLKKIEEKYGINIIWIESVTNHGIRKTSDYIIVDFYSAKRDGSVFEEMIKKYGIPNKSYPHCTRELKNEPVKQWCKDNFNNNYEIAIGIRLDEKEREPKNNIYKTIYPLIKSGITKNDVIDFWAKQEFRLGIENYQGNCKTCWKKSYLKLRLIAYENEKAFDFFMDMEDKHGLSGSNKDGVKRTFFRENRSAKDIIKASKESGFDYIERRKYIIDKYNQSLSEGGCSESCEPFLI